MPGWARNARLNAVAAPVAFGPPPPGRRAGSPSSSKRGASARSGGARRRAAARCPGPGTPTSGSAAIVAAVGAQHRRERAGRRRAVRADEPAVVAPRLGAGDPLLQDRRQQRLEDRARSAQPDAAVARAPGRRPGGEARARSPCRRHRARGTPAGPSRRWPAPGPHAQARISLPATRISIVPGPSGVVEARIAASAATRIVGSPAPRTSGPTIGRRSIGRPAAPAPACSRLMVSCAAPAR